MTFSLVAFNITLVKHDTQHNHTLHNHTQHNHTQHSDIQHSDIQHNTRQNMTLSITPAKIVLVVSVLYAERHLCRVAQINPIMIGVMNIIMLSAILLNVIIMSVVGLRFRSQVHLNVIFRLSSLNWKWEQKRHLFAKKEWECKNYFSTKLYLSPGPVP